MIEPSKKPTSVERPPLGSLLPAAGGLIIVIIIGLILFSIVKKIIWAAISSLVTLAIVVGIGYLGFKHLTKNRRNQY